MKRFLSMFAILTIFLLGTSLEAFAATNTYTVKKGDTLYRIAKSYKISVDALKTANHLKSDKIQLNQKLVIPTKAATPKTAVKAATTAQSTNDFSGLKVVKTITVSASAYTASCRNCSGITTLGYNLKKNPNLKVISVDPRVIKLGTKVYVEGYGYAIAADKGSAIKGNKIDVFMPSLHQALQWGRKTVKVKILQ
jgi:3D (Asp-Asp-Asp) domain-containing protein